MEGLLSRMSELKPAALQQLVWWGKLPASMRYYPQGSDSNETVFRRVVQGVSYIVDVVSGADEGEDQWMDVAQDTFEKGL